MISEELSEYEIAASIRSHLLRVVSEVMNYHKHWSNEFSIKSIDEITDKIKSANWFRFIDPYEFNQDQLLDLDFRRWSEDSQLMLAPLWLFQFLKDGVKYIDIDDQEIIFNKSDADNDNRYGCLSFGIIPNHD